jgi:hypothetical protein
MEEELVAIQAPGALVFRPVAIPVRVRGEGKLQSAAVESSERPHARITADPGLRRVTVQIDVSDPPWPLAILVPEDVDDLQAAEFRQVEGEDFLIAAFEDLDDGDYTLLLEDTNPEATLRP